MLTSLLGVDCFTVEFDPNPKIDALVLLNDDTDACACDFSLTSVSTLGVGDNGSNVKGIGFGITYFGKGGAICCISLPRVAAFRASHRLLALRILVGSRITSESGDAVGSWDGGFIFDVCTVNCNGVLTFREL